MNEGTSEEKMLRFRDQNPTQTSCMCIKARRLIQSPERTCYRCVRRPNERHRLRMLIYPVDEGLGEWGVCFNEVLLPFFLLFDIHWGYFQLAFARVFRENTPRSPRNKPRGQLAGLFASIRHAGGSFLLKFALKWKRWWRWERVCWKCDFQNPFTNWSMEFCPRTGGWGTRRTMTNEEDRKSQST